MALDDTTMLEFVIGGLAAAGVLMSGYLNMRTTKLSDAHNKHVLHVQDTYAKSSDMQAGFIAAAEAAKEAVRVAEAFGKDLNTKVDKTQEAIHRVEVVQAGQSENIKNMDKSLEAIANTIKDKAP